MNRSSFRCPRCQPRRPVTRTGDPKSPRCRADPRYCRSILPDQWPTSSEQGPETPRDPLPAGSAAPAWRSVRWSWSVLGLSRSGLLSADEPAPPEPDAVGLDDDARHGDAARAWSPGSMTCCSCDARGPDRAGSRLPADLPADAPLVPVRLRRHRGGDGVRTAWTGGGRARRVAVPGRPRPAALAVARLRPTPSSRRRALGRRALVVRDGALAGGRDRRPAAPPTPAPFPGFGPGAGRARGLLAVAGVRGTRDDPARARGG